MCLNTCVRIEGVTKKNKDCVPSNSKTKCNPTTRVDVGVTWTRYQMLDVNRNATELREHCVTCGERVLEGPKAIVVYCRNAEQETEEHPDCLKL